MKPSEIKAALVAKGVRQADIARQTEYSGPYVHDVIVGNRRNERIETAIAEAIGRPVEEVFPVASAPAA